MDDRKKYSVLVRVICGLLGFGGGLAILNTLSLEEFMATLKLFSVFYACFIFLYVAILGKSPLKALKKISQQNVMVDK